MLTALLVVLSLVAAVATLAANLMSEKPTTVAAYLRAFGRLGIFAACVVLCARLLTGGAAMPLDTWLWVTSVAVIYASQAIREARRQRKQDAGATTP